MDELTLTENNLKISKVGDVFVFENPICRGISPMQTVKAEVIKKTKKEILLLQVNALFSARIDTIDNIKDWEKSGLCFYLKNMVQGLPFISDCTILSQEEIEQYFPTEASRIKLYDDEPTKYWTKTCKDEITYVYYKCVNLYGRIEEQLPNTFLGVIPVYIIKAPNHKAYLEDKLSLE